MKTKETNLLEKKPKQSDPWKNQTVKIHYLKGESKENLKPIDELNFT